VLRGNCNIDPHAKRIPGSLVLLRFLYGHATANDVITDAFELCGLLADQRFDVRRFANVTESDLQRNLHKVNLQFYLRWATDKTSLLKFVSRKIHAAVNTSRKLEREIFCVLSSLSQKMIEVGLVTFHKLFLIALAGHRNGSDSLTLAPMLGKSYPKGKSRQLS